LRIRSISSSLNDAGYILNLKRITDTLRSYNYRTINFRLIIYAVLLSVIGVFVIGSATDDNTYVYKQIVGLVGGLILMVIVMLIRYDFIARYYWLMYFFAIGILIVVLSPLGETHMGAQRWISVFGVQVQPSELAKLLLMIFFSALIAKNQTALNSWKFVLIMIALAVIPVILIYREPDLSSSVVTFVIICAIIFTSDLRGRFIKIVALIAVPIGAAILALIILLPPDRNIVDEYQYNRLVGFYDAENEVAAKIRYQQENSIIAIANGGLTGKGLNNNSITSVKNAEYISEPQTDFIFTIVGEELGLAGSFAVILLLVLIVIECFRVGFRAREQIGRGIAVGLGTLIGFQSFINLGVVTMIIPNTGLTLPFISAGLSSLMVLYINIGIVLNIGMHKKITF